MTKSRPVLIIFSTLAGLGVITASSGLADLIGMKAALVLILLREAVQVGMNFYVQGQVVPIRDVAAFDSKTEAGVVAGPAAAAENGSPVDVLPSQSSVPGPGTD